MQDEYKFVSSFKHSYKGHFFTDPSLLKQSFDFKPEDEWTESYQPSGIDQVHALGLSSSLEGNTYLDPSLLSCEDETVKEWELREDFSPQHDFHRRSTGSYEGDEETSVVDLTFQSKNSTENGIRYQEKVTYCMVSLCYAIIPVTLFNVCMSHAFLAKRRKFSASEAHQRAAQKVRG